MILNTLPSPLIIAHRGFKARAPENTLVAFQAALDAGAKMIELDVTLTRDRQVVVIHDETLERTTNGMGEVRHHTLRQIKNLDAGSWFSAEFKGEPIPTLDEVLSLCRTRARVNVEIKPEAIDRVMMADSIENQVLSKLAGHGMTDRVIVSSFEKKVIERIASMGRRKPLLALLSEDPLDLGLLDFMVRHNVFSYNPDHRTLTPQDVEAVHDQGLKVLTYTVNTKEDAKRCFNMGVDGIFTDDPVLMEEVVRGM